MSTRATSNLSQPSRDGAIDLLRALLVVYVIAYLHLGGYIADGQRHVHWATPAITNVVLGTFTFLSGYVLGTWKGKASAAKLANFYWRRLLRIYPLYLLALTGFVLLWLCDLQTAVKAAFAVSMLWPEPPMTLWFVTMIIVCYALAPALIIPSLRRSLLTAAGLWLAMLAFNFGAHEIDPRMLTQFAAFVAGISCRRLDLRRVVSNHLSLLTVAFSVALIAAIATLHHPLLGAIVAVPSVMLGPMLLLVVADRVPVELGQHRIMALLSYLSFSAYLFHRIVFEIVKRWAWPAHEWAQWAVLLVVGVPAVLVTSALIQSGYDRLIVTLAASPAFKRRNATPGSSSR